MTAIAFPAHSIVARPSASSARLHGRAIVRRASAAMMAWLEAKPAKPAAPAISLAAKPASRRVATPTRAAMPVDLQWQRIVATIERTIRRGQTVAELHGAAALRIDSTQYEIALLKLDLAPVLSHHRGANT